MTCKCGRPTADGIVQCAHCRRTTHHAITNVAVYYDDLDTVRTGQTRYGMPAKGSIGREGPLGMDPRFGPGEKGTRLQAAVRASVVAWAKGLMSLTGGDAPTHDSVRSVCAYLDRNLGVVVTQGWAPAFQADMLGHENALRAMVDRPPEQWYAGECGAILGEHNGDYCACACHFGTPGVDPCDIEGGCGWEINQVTCTKVLYAEPEKDFVKCQPRQHGCGTEWPVAERRDLLLREAEDYNATVRMLARIVTTLGGAGSDGTVSEAKLENRINVWVHRGRLKAVGTRVVDGKIRPTYRVGDVLERLSGDIGHETAAREARRETRQAAEATRGTTERAS